MERVEYVLDIGVQGPRGLQVRSVWSFWLWFDTPDVMLVRITKGVRIQSLPYGLAFGSLCTRNYLSQI